MSSSDLARDIDATCRLTGRFTLRSGQESTEYFDKYLFESDPALLGRVADAMVDLLPADTELLGGLELGGVPIVTVLSLRTARSTAPASSPKGPTCRADGSPWSRT
jgi:orotate phosphoribosyltransferase